MSKSKNITLSNAWMYDMVRAPVITEKSTLVSQHNQVAFHVPLQATKDQIKKAVEAIFSVKVAAVNTLIHKGKLKRFKGVQSRRSDRKKAIVTLAEGSRIDIAAGI